MTRRFAILSDLGMDAGPWKDPQAQVEKQQGRVVTLPNYHHRTCAQLALQDHPGGIGSARMRVQVQGKGTRERAG
jgi:hypothetical protein